jgi:hypothetical protein
MEKRKRKRQEEKGKREEVRKNVIGRKKKERSYERRK